MYDNFGGYLKRSFKTILDNTILFLPVFFNFLLFLIPAGLVFLGIRSMNFPMSRHFAPMVAIFIVVTIIVLIIQVLIEAGKSNMIKKSILNGLTDMNDFMEGIKKYTGKIFLGNLLLVGITIIIALIVIPIVMSIGSKNAFILLGIFLFFPMLIILLFISFWQTILVYEDCDIFESFRLSFTFVKNHFWLVLFVNILKGIFTGNNNGNRRRRGFINFNINGIFNYNIDPSYVMTRLGFFSIIAIILGLIKALLTLYFDVMFFIIYHDRRRSIFDDNFDNSKDDCLNDYKNDTI